MPTIAVMATKPITKQKKAPKKVLRLPDLDHSERTVLDSLGYRILLITHSR
jgi:cephalosporin hydroxylase